MEMLIRGSKRRNTWSAREPQRTASKGERKQAKENEAKANEWDLQVSENKGKWKSLRRHSASENESRANKTEAQANKC